VLLFKSPKETLLGTWGTYWEHHWEHQNLKKSNPTTPALSHMAACLNHLIGCMKILSLGLVVTLFDLG
jgi:hypothetical protein